MSFGENLYKIRKEQGLSQEELAQLIGISRQAISKWELGEAMPDLTNLNAMADALDMSIDDLCERETKAEQIPEQKQKTPIWKTAFICIVCILIGLFAGFNIGDRKSEPMPEDMTISVVGFYRDFNSGKTTFSFKPNIIKDEYTYSIYFIPKFEHSVSVYTETVPINGTCAGEVELDELAVYTVHVEVTNGEETRVIPVAQFLSVEETSVAWAAA